MESARQKISETRWDWFPLVLLPDDTGVDPKEWLAMAVVKILDGTAFLQLDHGYLVSWPYHHFLKQRNALLKKFAETVEGFTLWSLWQELIGLSSYAFEKSELLQNWRRCLPARLRNLSRPGKVHDLWDGGHAGWFSRILPKPSEKRSWCTKNSKCRHS